MKCLMNKLFGNIENNEDNDNMCVPFNPLIVAIISSILFLTFTTVLSYILR